MVHVESWERIEEGGHGDPPIPPQNGSDGEGMEEDGDEVSHQTDVQGDQEVQGVGRDIGVGEVEEAEAPNRPRGTPGDAVRQSGARLLAATHRAIVLRGCADLESSSAIGEAADGRGAEMPSLVEETRGVHSVRRSLVKVGREGAAAVGRGGAVRLRTATIRRSECAGGGPGRDGPVRGAAKASKAGHGRGGMAGPCRSQCGKAGGVDVLAAYGGGRFRSTVGEGTRPEADLAARPEDMIGGGPRKGEKGGGRICTSLGGAVGAWGFKAASPLAKKRGGEGNGSGSNGVGPEEILQQVQALGTQSRKLLIRSNKGLLLLALCGRGREAVGVGMWAWHFAPSRSLGFLGLARETEGMATFQFDGLTLGGAHGLQSRVGSVWSDAGQGSGAENEDWGLEQCSFKNWPLAITDFSMEVGGQLMGRTDSQAALSLGTGPCAQRMVALEATRPRTSKRLAGGDKTPIPIRAMTRKASQREGREGSGVERKVKGLIRKSGLCGVKLGEAEAADFGEFLGKWA